MKSIAVLITCHNRKSKTLKCLENLSTQELPSDYRLEIYLVDDGSTDGTGDAVRANFPDVNVIRADGSLFWSGGMHLAWQHAAKADPEFYLWMNDDTYLLPKCLHTLLQTWKQYAAAGQERCIVVASCYDPETGKHSYGGEMTRGGHPGRPIAVLPDPQSPKVCETFNGNCVLVPRATFRVLGILRRFRHSISDTDYGLYATRHGFPVVLAAGYPAECVLNPIFECPHSSWQNPALPRSDRWQLLLGRRGLPPLDWWRFLWAHAGIRALWYWPTPYVRVLVGR
jgi:GT2 family glycosyltransferase